jgi:centromere protein C
MLMRPECSKTGLTIPDSGIRDEHGMEPLEAVFSSPEKPKPAKSAHVDEEEEVDESDDNDTGEAMDITTSMTSLPAFCAAWRG